MQNEQQSGSDPNSRAQQTDISHLRDHWKPNTSSQASAMGMDDPLAKPSQTEASFLREHHTPKYGRSETDTVNAQSASGCQCSSRSKSADPPPVKSPICVCDKRAQAQVCGMVESKPPSSQQSCSCKKDSKSKSGGALLSAVSTCTKEILKPCGCGSSKKPCYCPNQSNIVAGPSSSRQGRSKQVTAESSKATGTALFSCSCDATEESEPDPCEQKLKPCASKSQPNMADQSYQSGSIWLSALKDAEDVKPPPEPKRPCPAQEFTDTAAQTSRAPSAASCPQSRYYNPSFESKGSAPKPAHPCSQPSFGTENPSYGSKVSGPKSSHPCNQPSFGMNEETSATTRSRSIVGKITCLCGSDEQPTVEYCTDQGQQQEDQNSFMPCPSARIQHSSAFKDYISGEAGPTKKSSSKKVCMVEDEKFCDCSSAESIKKPSTATCQDDISECCKECEDSKSGLMEAKSCCTEEKSGCIEQPSDCIITSLKTHRSISGGSCMCDKDEDEDPPAGDLSQSACVLKDCKCYVKTSKYDISMQGSYNQSKQGDEMCSCVDVTGFQTPEDACGLIKNMCASRKERVLGLLDQLSKPSCDCGVSRASLIQQLFREITLLLRSERESAIAPAEEPPPPEVEFEDCCTTQHERGGESPPKKVKTKAELRREECFEAMEDYVRRCYMPREPPPIPVQDIYGFEIDPEFCPDGVQMDPTQFLKDPNDKFQEIGDVNTCDGNPPDCGNSQSLRGSASEKASIVVCGEMYQDCQGYDEKDPPCQSKPSQNSEDSICPGAGDEDDPPCPCNTPDFCTKLRAFYKSKKALMTGDAEMDDKAASTYQFLKNLCEASSKKSPCSQDKGDLAEDLLPAEPLPPEIRRLCEDLLRQALKECNVCEDTGGGSCDGDDAGKGSKPCDEEGSDGHGDQAKVCPEELPEECPDECPSEGEEEGVVPFKGDGDPGPGCLCCHCRALICDDECKTVAKTLRSAMCDPICEMVRIPALNEN